jgi:hypothetical protein
VTIPAVHVPKDGRIRTPLDFTLRSDWWFDTKRRVFRSDSGETFSPAGTLPSGSRIVYKVPSLARTDASKLNEHERELRRYMQIIMPHGESPARYLRAVCAWPTVEEAHVAPEVSLPGKH